MYLQHLVIHVAFGIRNRGQSISLTAGLQLQTQGAHDKKSKWKHHCLGTKSLCSPLCTSKLPILLPKYARLVSMVVLLCAGGKLLLLLVAFIDGAGLSLVDASALPAR